MSKPESAGEVKLLANRMAQLEFFFKDKRSRESKSFTDLALFKDEPLSDDFKLPNFINFDGTGGFEGLFKVIRHLHGYY